MVLYKINNSIEIPLYRRYDYFLDDSVASEFYKTVLMIVLLYTNYYYSQYCYNDIKRNY